MPPLKRRHFLQAAGSALAAIGLSQLDVMRQGDRYGRLLAQPTPRKLALLVGINDYAPGISPLRGCVTDVQMQRELLVHRFGFNPNDILVLTDAAATRENMLAAFESHLIKQAQPNDVVVFHFSGHGAVVIDPDPIPLPRTAGYAGFEGYNGTMVPYDGRLNIRGDEVNDIMGKTLFLLMSALKTDQVTVMLDSCHSGGGTRGDLRFRALETRVGQVGDRPSEAELAFQEQLMSQLNLSPTRLKQLRTEGIAKGVAMGSAQANQLAADASFGRPGAGRFFAGAFTYALTRYLWQQPSSLPLERVFVDLARSTRDVARTARLEQFPIYETAPGSNHHQKPLYFTAPQTPAAEAVVLGPENDQVRFWLGGVSSQSLDAFEEGAIFSIIDNQGNEVGQIEQTQRVGLEGYGVLTGSSRSMPPAGTLLRERVRGIPADLTLRLGLDPSLGADMAEMQSRLRGVSRVEPVAVNGENSPHFLLGRMTNQGLSLAATEGIQGVGTIGSLGLFTPGMVPIRDTFGAPNESVSAAILRLNPQFKVLLAGRILRSVLNSDTSDLKIDVTVQPVGGGRVVGSSGSRGSRSTEVVAQRIDSRMEPLISGSEVVINVTNREARPIHVGVLAIGGTGRITVLHPTDWDAPEAASLLEPTQSIRVPSQERNRDLTRDYCTNPSEAFHLCLSGSGHLEILTIASTSPLRDALRGIQQIAEANDSRAGRPLSLQDDGALNVVGDLLGELDRDTRGDIEVRSSGVRAIDVTKMAALSTIIHIVED